MASSSQHQRTTSTSGKGKRSLSPLSPGTLRRISKSIKSQSREYFSSKSDSDLADDSEHAHSTGFVIPTFSEVISNFGELFQAALAEETTTNQMRDIFRPLIAEQTQLHVSAIKETLTEEFQKMTENIKAGIMTEITEIKKDLNDQKEQVTNLDERLTDTTTRVDTLEEEMKKMKVDSVTTSADESSATANIKEEISKTVENELEKIRKSHELETQRTKNLIIHGAEETEEKDITTRMKNDSDFIVTTFRNLNVHTTVTRYTRLGKFDKDSTRPRLLLVSVASDADQKEILRKSRTLETILITPDRSKVEREQRKQLRDTLNTRKANGELNLVIRNNEIVVKDPDSRRTAFTQIPLRI